MLVDQRAGSCPGSWCWHGHYTQIQLSCILCPIPCPQLSKVARTATTAAVPDFAFLTNHGKTLLLIAHDPRIRMRDIAGLLRITERATQRIVADLARAGYVDREREGRRNLYSVRTDMPLGLPIQRDVDIESLLAVLPRRTTPATRRLRRPCSPFRVDPHRVRRLHVESEEHHMYATVRRYEGIDTARSEEIATNGRSEPVCRA